ncbi:MAG: hypothetical protein SWY16_12870 [Cyanobacteriota bacterium]|nr:hypothetical protein [Cyanobacteriota bacterium]
MYFPFWQDFIIEGTEDDVGLWEIICEIERENPNIEAEAIQEIALDLIREILETELMAIGMFEFVDGKNLEYQIWQLDIDRIIDRLKTEWDELGRVPNIGDIAWLITTPKGEDEAKRILEERQKLN